MTIYVMDLFSVRQIGMSLGSDENDKLEYCMFRGTGNIVVQLAIRELSPDMDTAAFRCPHPVTAELWKA